MERFKDIKGQRFVRLVAIKRVGTDNRRASLWECKCDCGSFIVARINSLTNGNTQSCGCLRREHIVQALIKRNTTHGMAHSRTYRAWTKMKERCENPNTKCFKDYGGRGIVLCKKWSNSFEEFYREMGDCPPKYTVERIDNNGNYELGNCRWATRKEQNNNKRSNRFIEYSGERKTLAQWGESTGISQSTLTTRLRNGWTIEKALNIPVRGRITYAA